MAGRPAFMPSISDLNKTNPAVELAAAYCQQAMAAGVARSPDMEKRLKSRQP